MATLFKKLTVETHGMLPHHLTCC